MWLVTFGAHMSRIYTAGMLINHSRVRLLSYAGIPLLFAIPSFVLSCLSSILLFSSQRHPGRTSPAPTGTPSHKATPRESFTAFPAPRRERPRLSTLMTKRAPPCASLAASELDTVLQTPATTVFDPPTPRAASATPSGQEQIIYLVPSRTPSDPARTSVGRAPISPVVARHSRHYHLPFSWRTASTLSLPADKEGEHDTGSLHSFLPTMTPSSTRTTPELHIHHMHLFPKLMYGQPSSSTFLAELDGDGCGCSGHREEELDVFWDGTTGEIFYDDDGGVGDDIETMSGSMRWARPSFASDETKSPELAFARASTGSAPVMYTCASPLLLTHSAHSCDVRRPDVRAAVGRARERGCVAGALLSGLPRRDADHRHDNFARGRRRAAGCPDALRHAACRAAPLRVGADACIRCAPVAAARIAHPGLCFISLQRSTCRDMSCVLFVDGVRGLRVFLASFLALCHARARCRIGRNIGHIMFFTHPTHACHTHLLTSPGL